MTSRHKGRPVPAPSTPALDTAARRIRACLTACEGLTTEALEDGMVTIVFDAQFHYRALLAELRDVAARLHTMADGHCAAVELARGQPPDAHAA